MFYFDHQVFLIFHKAFWFIDQSKSFG